LNRCLIVMFTHSEIVVKRKTSCFKVIFALKFLAALLFVNHDLSLNMLSRLLVRNL